MTTKLSRYAEGVMEAAWIAAIIMTPLFFNKYSSRIFEPDKATLLRTLALIILGAWLIKTTEMGFSKSDPNKSWAKNFFLILREPIVPFVFALSVVYLISTLLSVTPGISFWGSYQRLQGFYTTLSYVVVFASLAANLRRKEQIERLITVAILTSLPVSLYGVLQKYGIDPIPWGGNVTNRVASHMGNSIFVAAYLIMVFPLTIGRIINAFSKILSEDEGLVSQVARSTIYVFIAALQIIAIYFSRSRGPFLGLIASLFFLFVLLSLHWRKRWMTFSVIGIATFVAGFIVLLNVPNGPLEALRESPSVGRFGQLLDTDQRTSQVRILIWQGAAEMVAPHEPLEYPDGHKDPLNGIRPLIGYGPETMHMAYNPFYPPELAHFEKRNASPDRSHNETWDSLVITGIFGFVVYMGLYAAIFYYGLKWLGFINTQRQKILFFSFYFGGGLILTIGFYIWQGIEFLGVALPFGMILGLIGYLTLNALFIKYDPDQEKYDPNRDFILIVLLSAILAHFVEINFGIAIVSTRTYFFVYAALLLLVGYILQQRGEFSLVPTANNKSTSAKPTRQRGKKKRSSGFPDSILYRSNAIGSLVTSMLLLPLLYEYISNIHGGRSASQILWDSLTRVNQDAISYGVLALVLTTWFASSMLFAAEKQSNIWKSFASILGISMLLALVYGIFLSGSLARIARNAPETINDVLSQATAFENLLTQFYIFMILGLLILGFYLPAGWPKRSTNPSSFGVILGPVVFVLVIGISYFTNWRIIQADITFKLAEPFSSSGQWPVANALYQRAKDYAPDEDYYDLFLGRGYLEYAKTISDFTEKQTIFEKAEGDLKKAQDTNPLNPDHTANLARLNSWWASQTEDQEERNIRGLISDDYYSRVLVLSPNNARLWAEWGALHLDILKNQDRAFELLNQSIEIDPAYDWSQALLGNYYLQIARQTEDPEEKELAFQNSITHYRTAIGISKNLNYYFALATIYQAKNDLEELIIVLEESLEFARNKNDVWRIEENLAVASLQLGRKLEALKHAQLALEVAPESEHERLNLMIRQIEEMP
jgi:tetratricopeptide (TPR) repeat protein/O-antigen ligase